MSRLRSCRSPGSSSRSAEWVGAAVLGAVVLGAVVFGLMVAGAGCGDDSGAPVDGSVRTSDAAPRDATPNDATPNDAAPNDAATRDAGDAGTVRARLRILDVITNQPVPGRDPASGTLHRVELPPEITLEAVVPSTTTRVELFVDGELVYVDELAPYRLTEDEDGAALPWEPGFGTFEVVAVVYAGPIDGSEEIARVSVELELSSRGMDPDPAPMDEDATRAWVSGMLETALERRTFTDAAGTTIAYRLYQPAFYDPAVSYPLVMFLHGRGQRGTDNEGTFRSRLFTGDASLVAPNGQKRFPSFVVVPQCLPEPENQEWAAWVGSTPEMPFRGLGADGSYEQAPEPSASGRAAKGLVEALIEEFSIDADRVYLTGESMGGFGTWELTARWPALWAVGVPMAGFSDRSTADRVVAIPYWVFHGAADASNPVEGSRAMVAAVNAAGGTARLTEYAGLGHGETFERAWTTEGRLLPWMFSQHR